MLLRDCCSRWLAAWPGAVDSLGSQPRPTGNVVHLGLPYLWVYGFLYENHRRASR